MTSITRTRSLRDTDANIILADTPHPEYRRLHVPRSSFESWDETCSTSTPSTPRTFRRAGRTTSFSLARGLATPLSHRHSVSELSCDRLRLRTLELDLPRIAERLRMAAQRMESTQRRHGFTDVVAQRERDDALDALMEFKMLTEVIPPPQDQRRSPQVRPVPRDVSRWLNHHGPGPSDDALMAKI